MAASLRTEHALLRPWRRRDRAAFAELNADPAVMEHFPALLDRVASDELARRCAAGIEERGWGLWALEVPGELPYAGFVGLNPVTWPLPLATADTPPVEVGWRLSRRAWGRGLATEGALAAIDHAFDELGLLEVISFTVDANDRSRRVMEKAGLAHRPGEEFDHAAVPLDAPWARRHVLYRISAAGHARQREDPGLRVLADALGRINLCVRRRDWEPLVRGLAPGAVAELSVAGAELRLTPGGPPASSAPPTHEFHVLQARREGNCVVAAVAGADARDRPRGELRIDVAGTAIAGLRLG